MEFRQNITFIGAGKMATAIVLGLLRNGCESKWIKAYDVSPQAAESFYQTTGIRPEKTMLQALDSAEIVLLAVKPQYAAAALDEAKSSLNGKLLISIAAGLPISFLQEKTGIQRIVRVMPNTPALVGQGVSCYAPGEGVEKSDTDVVNQIFSAVGKAFQVGENQLDAVTGLSGSGPAFVLEFIMALADGGVYEGLPRAAALEMAAQTVLGTAELMLQEKQHPAELRDAVISPGGTTARGVMALEQGGFRGVTASAVLAAAERSRELGKKL